MKIGKYQFFKKEMYMCGSYHGINVVNTETNEQFVLNHTCKYMFYTKKEEENIVFNLFKKAIELMNKSRYINAKFLSENRLEITYY